MKRDVAVNKRERHFVNKKRYTPTSRRYTLRPIFPPLLSVAFGISTRQAYHHSRLEYKSDSRLQARRSCEAHVIERSTWSVIYGSYFFFFFFFFENAGFLGLFERLILMISYCGIIFRNSSLSTTVKHLELAFSELSLYKYSAPLYSAIRIKSFKNYFDVYIAIFYLAARFMLVFSRALFLSFIRRYRKWATSKLNCYLRTCMPRSMAFASRLSICRRRVTSLMA